MIIQQHISLGIRKNLFDNEFLVLPDFGGFVLKKQSSVRSSSGTSILPPSKIISFNVQLKQNDGVLQQWLCRELNCTAAESAAHLKEFSGYCKAVLENKGRLNIEGIGFFFSDLENNICFEPVKENFLRSSFGLEPVLLKELEPIEVKKENDYTDRILTHLETEQKENTRRFRRFRKFTYASIALISLLSVLFAVVSNTRFTGKIMSTVFHSDGKSTYSPIEYPELKLRSTDVKIMDYSADVNGIAPLELEPRKSVAVRAVIVEHETTEKVKRTPSLKRGDFEVVLGCFSIESNARKLVRKLKSKDIDAFISGTNEKGLHVVSGGGYNSKEEAAAQMNVLKSACPNAWIRKVN